jgi:segregation and condensation protein A
VFLDAFEGPLDLLLYLIRRQNLDICDIPIAEITQQYMQYVELMQELRLELAAEYLVMAAMLCEIKSRLLLPRPPASEDDEEDPRAELVRQLQEYERFKEAAEDMDGLPRLERDVHQALAATPTVVRPRREVAVSLQELLAAMSDVMQRAEWASTHHIQREALSVRERMSHCLAGLSRERFCVFSELFAPNEGKLGVVVTFLAVLELLKEDLVELVQSEPLAPIYVRAAAGSEAIPDDAADGAYAE